MGAESMGEKLNLIWHTFSSHGQDLFKNLKATEEFSDVTLISDDQHQYKVHKFMLSACSTVFKSILNNCPLNTSIYLRGIHHEELEAILQFIYLGEASINHERMNQFLNVAINIDVKDIGSILDNQNSEVKEDKNDVDNLEEEDVKHDDQSETDSKPKKKTSKKTKSSDSSISLIPNNEEKSYLCDQCDYQATTLV